MITPAPLSYSILSIPYSDYSSAFFPVARSGRRAGRSDLPNDFGFPANFVKGRLEDRSRGAPVADFARGERKGLPADRSLPPRNDGPPGDPPSRDGFRNEPSSRLLALLVKVRSRLGPFASSRRTKGFFSPKERLPSRRSPLPKVRSRLGPFASSRRTKGFFSLKERLPSRRSPLPKLLVRSGLGLSLRKGRFSLKDSPADCPPEGLREPAAGFKSSRRSRRSNDGRCPAPSLGPRSRPASRCSLRGRDSRFFSSFHGFV